MRDFLNTRFADPTVDFAFKRIFGTEQYKDATLGLLDSLFPELHIADVSFPNTELLGETANSRKGFIDVLCVDGDGNEFIVEMQNARQEREVYTEVQFARGEFGEKDAGLHGVRVSGDTGLRQKV